MNAAPPRYSPPRPIESADDLAGFECDEPALTAFLQRRALKNEGRGASRTYVVCAATGDDAGRVVAYYSLSMGSMPRDALPGAMRRNMPEMMPVALVGRLAVDRRHVGNRLGQDMLMEAIRRSLEAARHVGTSALVVQAISDRAVAFYRRFGFMPTLDEPMTLYLPLKVAAEALEEAPDDAAN